MRRSLFMPAIRLLRWALVLLLPACTDPYFPDTLQSPPSYLVVDGFLNAQGITTIKLSRTYAVAAKTAPPAETRATLYLEDENGTRVATLREAPAGTYTSPVLALNPARRYRLHMYLQAGKEYASGFVPVKITPPIDAVTWNANGNGLRIGVDTHDPTGTTRYYRWETDETWEIYPIYHPSVEYVNGSMRSIVVAFPNLCWGNAHSTTVLLDKTTALTQDVVTSFRVKQLPFNNERLHGRYSILVQQHALTKEEFAYWELLRKNTEAIGSLFDPQPAQLTGNVSCASSPGEIVLGYVSAHSLTEKRIFIKNNELPAPWHPDSGYESCYPPDTVYIDRPPPVKDPAAILSGAFSGNAYLPIETLYGRGVNGIIGYTGKSRDCIDCRTRGTAVKPSFWP